MIYLILDFTLLVWVRTANNTVFSGTKGILAFIESVDGVYSMLQLREIDLLVSLSAKERSALLNQLDDEIDLLCRPFDSPQKDKEKTVKMHSFLTFTVEEAAELYKVEIEVLSYIAKYENGVRYGKVNL